MAVAAPEYVVVRALRQLDIGGGELRVLDLRLGRVVASELSGVTVVNGNAPASVWAAAIRQVVSRDRLPRDRDIARGKFRPRPFPLELVVAQHVAMYHQGLPAEVDS